MQKMGLFVDITNQYYAALNAHPDQKIDYAKYLDRAKDGFNLYRAFAYGVQMDSESEPFIKVLRTLGYDPKYRKAVMSGRQPDIRRTDRNIMLAMDVWRCIDKLDVVIVGSNDPDLRPLVERIKELGVRVLIFSCNVSRELQDSADGVLEINASIFRKGRVPE